MGEKRVGQIIEYHMRSNLMQRKLIGVMFLLSLAMLVTTCSTYGNQMQKILPATIAAISPSDSPAPNITETARITPTRNAFNATVSAQIDLTANAVLTSMPTPTPTFTPVPRDTLPAPFTPIAAMMPTLMRPRTASDNLVTLMLRQYTLASNSNPFYYYVNSGNTFGIELVKDTLNTDWNTSDASTNDNKTFSVFLSSPPPPANRPEATISVEEYANWLQARKMLIKDLRTGAIYRVAWIDLIPWRPIELEGWITNNIFVFSQFGNPWHGFLTAVDARKREFLLTIQLEY